jgi:capsid protein
MLVGAIPAISIREYAVNPKKFEAVRFKPRGWSWIDPSSEVDAYEKAVKNGFMTVSDVVAKTGDGRDIEDVLTERERELEMMDEKDLVFETSPEVYTADSVKLNAEADAAANPPEPPPQPPAQDATNEPAPRRVLSLQR